MKGDRDFTQMLQLCHGGLGLLHFPTSGTTLIQKSELQTQVFLY
jgi:hypothetical protein